MANTAVISIALNGQATETTLQILGVFSGELLQPCLDKAGNCATPPIHLISEKVYCLSCSRLAISHFSADRIATGVTTNDTGSQVLSGCNNLHNCTASTATTKRNQVEPIEYNVPATEIIAKFGALISAQGQTQVVKQDETYLHATYKTLLLGYIDDLELLLDQSTGVLHIRSASRIGKSDFGANRKRIEALRELLQRN